MTLCASCRSFLGIESLYSFEKVYSVLGSEPWEDDDFSSMLDLVKDYIIDI